MGEVVNLKFVEKVRKKIGKPKAVPHTWLCKRCEHDIGVSTSEIMETRMSPVIKNLKVQGGRKRWICAVCQRRGVLTEVF